MELLKTSIIFKQRNSHERLENMFFALYFLQLANEKIYIATLWTITIEKPDLTFLLILYFHGFIKYFYD